MATSTAAVDTTPAQSTETMEKQMSTELKIKIKTLTAESRFIRHEEELALSRARYTESRTEEARQRAERQLSRTASSVKSLVLETQLERGPLPEQYREQMLQRAARARAGFTNLREHRVNVVRRAARHNCLAYGFLRGHAYSKLEQKAYTKPNWTEVEKLVKRFGDEDPRILMQRFSDWLDAAQKHYSTVTAE